MSANSLKHPVAEAEERGVQPQVPSDGNTEPLTRQVRRARARRDRRARTRQARRQVGRVLRLAIALVVLGLSAGVAVSVVTMHLGVRPVLTGSMRPDYGPGAILFTRRVPISSLRPGMIVLFIPPGEHAEYAHRITTVTGPADSPIITTKGDANTAADPWHAKLPAPYVNQVIGSLPGLGRVFVTIRGTGQIILALLGGCIALWAGSRWVFSSPSRSPRRRATVGSA
jgi:signal peptidase